MIAFSDVHVPRYLALLERSIRDYSGKKIDLVLMAGDLVERSNVPNLKLLLETLYKYIEVRKIVSVFGNEEYRELENEFRARYPEITWLNDEYTVTEAEGKCLSIVGSRGSLVKPTSWQRKNIPNIEEEYKRKPYIIRELINEARKECENVIYLSHYAPTWRTLIGERRQIWPYLGDPRIEKVLLEEGVKIAIHGHVHRGRVSFAKIGDLTIFNVALPARGKVTQINLDT
ncbi:metallophosphoesterase family protein [Ignicoccus islandicus]|uniref:metallophosphoesterase family protein n=1 Tax=Ignicoccus islandicus TaxID=54259 RepID=UPI001F2FA459|nr:metallophosphoesterase [Ignicoccus islandicus]